MANRWLAVARRALMIQQSLNLFRSGMTLYILGIVLVAPAKSTTLRFDDLPAKDDNNTSDVIREEYSGFGVHFNSDGRHGGIVRAGVANGDPGNWDLDGTNGPYFLGHNSFGRTGRIEFDFPVSNFLVDAARGSVRLVT